MNEEQLQPTQETTPRWLTTFLIGFLATALTGTFGYTLYQSNRVKAMAVQNEQIQASLSSTNAQLSALAAKLDSLTAPKVISQPAPVAVHVRKHNGEVRVRMADGRWKKVQSQIDEQGKAIESTRQDLASTRTELQGSIARTHEELVVLQRRGERNYFEFDLEKAKHAQAEGPIGIRLRKANVKHQYADLELVVDDVSLTKKHVNLYEPAMFYAADSEHPVELIINKITKNHIHGYVSAPKYRRSELTAMSQPSTADGAQDPASAPRQRQTLALPPR